MRVFGAIAVWCFWCAAIFGRDQWPLGTHEHDALGVFCGMCVVAFFVLIFAPGTTKGGK